MTPAPVSIPGLVMIEATEMSTPPAWALTQRKLIETLEQAVYLFRETNTDADGNVNFVHDVDDVFESRGNKALLYAIGAHDSLLDIALTEWNATTRFYDDGNVTPDDDEVHPMFMAQLHREYWNLAIPFNSEWFHMGEGNQAFYEFGVADPTVRENVRRAKRFAAMYMGEDPEAPNYDPEYKIIRSPFHSSVGPLLQARGAPPLLHTGGYKTGDLEPVRAWLDRGSIGDFGHRRGKMGTPSEKPLLTPLYPVVKKLEGNWFEDPERRAEILRLFDEVVLNGDEPSSLTATGLMTNAYLYTGDEKYKRWVLDYVEVWMDRIKENNGIIPDNVGPTGKIGEQRQGQWWGGMHGWNRSGGNDRMFMALVIGAECAQLLSGDSGYLELLRSQLKVLLDNSTRREDGHLLIPNRYGPDGWAEPTQPRVRDFIHLYHASMAYEDYELVTMLRDGDKDNDWNEVTASGDGKGGNTDAARFQYYDGILPDWPEKIMRADYQQALKVIDALRNDTRDAEQMLADNWWPPNPVVIKGLVNLTMGTPTTMYNGGLLRAQVRLFDRDRARPGLPPDVAALVDKLESDATGIQLVNTSPTEPRNVIVQAGAFGEHQFTGLSYNQESYQRPAPQPSMWPRGERVQTQKTAQVDSECFAVKLPPSTSVRIEATMRRFVNDPNYAFPWHH